MEKHFEIKPPLHLANIYYLYIFNSRNFFPYILILSCIFLLATFIIYTVVPNLLNKYTRLRRHYVITIMIAFIIIAINNFVGTQEIHPIFCKLFGKYSFLIHQKKKILHNLNFLTFQVSVCNTFSWHHLCLWSQ